MRMDLASSEPDYDIAIVGARSPGPYWRPIWANSAGASSDDRATFPSTTISTHFFRGAGLVGVLDELGILPAALATGAPPLVRQYDYATGSSEGMIGPPQDPGLRRLLPVGPQRAAGRTAGRAG